MNSYNIYKEGSDLVIKIDIEDREIKNIEIIEKGIDTIYSRLFELELKIQELLKEINSLVMNYPEIIIHKIYKDRECYLLIKDFSREEIIKRIYSVESSNKKNRLGCSENWYNPLYSLKETFRKEELEFMNEKELENLLRLAYNISEGLY